MVEVDCPSCGSTWVTSHDATFNCLNCDCVICVKYERAKLRRGKRPRLRGLGKNSDSSDEDLGDNQTVLGEEGEEIHLTPLKEEDLVNAPKWPKPSEPLFLSQLEQKKRKSDI